MANCATEFADAEAEPDVPDALDDATLAELLAELLTELSDAAPDEDDACDEPQPQSPSAIAVANATTANTFLFTTKLLFPDVLQTPLPFSNRSDYATANVLNG